MVDNFSLISRLFSSMFPPRVISWPLCSWTAAFPLPTGSPPRFQRGDRRRDFNRPTKFFFGVPTTHGHSFKEERSLFTSTSNPPGDLYTGVHSPVRSIRLHEVESLNLKILSSFRFCELGLPSYSSEGYEDSTPFFPPACPTHLLLPDSFFAHPMLDPVVVEVLCISPRLVLSYKEVVSIQLIKPFIFLVPPAVIVWCVPERFFVAASVCHCVSRSRSRLTF